MKKYINKKHILIFILVTGGMFSSIGYIYAWLIWFPNYHNSPQWGHIIEGWDPNGVWYWPNKLPDATNTNITAQIQYTDKSEYEANIMCDPCAKNFCTLYTPEQWVTDESTITK